MDKKITDAAAGVSTPLLIEQAFTRGEISVAERALYLAYALYEPQSLPPQFYSNVGWYGTEYVWEVQTYMQQVSASSTDAVQQELSRLSILAATVCDTEDGANTFNSTHFHFAYSTILGGLAIADYVTSMETTFNIEVTQFGWANPPLNANNPFGRYPIQIFALGSGLYGCVSGGGGGEDDIFICRYGSLGATTTCTFSLFWNGDSVGFDEDAIDGLAIGIPPGHQCRRWRWQCRHRRHHRNRG